MNMQTLVDAVNQDPELNRRGRYYSIQFRLEMDDRPLLFSIENGRLVSVVEDAGTPAAFTLKGSAPAWRQFFLEEPPPGYHDVAAMIDRGHVGLEGDPMPWLANMLYIKVVIDHWKAIHADV